MLIGIPKIISPELLKVLMEMGHGDEIVLGDANFPAASHSNKLIRADGHSMPALLDAILTLFPLDPYVNNPVALMQVVPGDPVETPIWEEYKQIIASRAGLTDAVEEVERFKFYDRSKQAYAIVATGEDALYANIIIRKGVIN